jgi:hypothetical protein
MRSHIVYPEATERIEKSWLWEKIEKKIKRDKLTSMPSPYVGHMMNSDYIDVIKELWKRLYYKKIPKRLRINYKETLDAILHDPHSKNWQVRRNSALEAIECDKGEILLFWWYFASEVLTPTQIWSPRKYWFENATDLIACVGEYVRHRLMFKSSMEWYTWTTAKDWKTYSTTIGASTHWDFRADRTDTTPYETIDPFWKKVNLRPKTSDDMQAINAYHSVESHFLMVILKWMDTAEIKSDLLNLDWEKISEFLSSLSGPNPFSCKCTENLTWETMFGNEARMVFVSFDIPMKNYNLEIEWGKYMRKWSHYGVWTSERWQYTAYVWDEDELIFSYMNYEKWSFDMQKNMVFYKEDATEILKWLIYQAVMNLWRTSLNEILGAMKYYLENREKLLTKQ